MYRHLAIAVIAMLCLGLFCSYPTLNSRAQTQANAESVAQQITELSPISTPPPLFAEIEEKADAVIMRLRY